MRCTTLGFVIRGGLPIESPEGIEFTYDLASLVNRGLAYAIDLLIRAAILLVVGILLALLAGSLRHAGLGLLLALYFAVEWGYYVFFELLWNGQTPGKKVLRLRVVKAAGYPIGFLDSVIRNLLRAVDALPPFGALPVGSYGVAAISMLVNGRFQRLGDIAAGTIVVCERQVWFVHSPGHQRHPASATTIHNIVLSRKERRLLAEFASRCRRLHPERREELAEILARTYRRRFPSVEHRSATDLLLKLYNTSAGGDK